MSTFTALPPQHSFTPDLMYSRSENVSRELLLNQTLKIRNEPKPSAPIYSNKPLTKEFPVNQNTANLRDPMQEILSTSRKLIANYAMELKFELNAAVPIIKKKPSISSLLAINESPSRRMKRTRQPTQGSFEKDDTYGSTPFIPTSATRNNIFSSSPAPNSNSVHGSVRPAMSKKPSLIKLTTAPSSMSIIQKKPSLKRILRTDLASMSELNDVVAAEPQFSTPVKRVSSGSGPLLECTPDYNDKESSYDQLACHADNILRMAVDSTLLGSSFNGSIMSNYSLGGPNDSMLGVLSRKKLNSNDIFDDNDPEKSLLELKKARWNVLNREKASKIEINADEINKVLGEV